jgi:hypothetical protein
MVVSPCARALETMRPLKSAIEEGLADTCDTSHTVQLSIPVIGLSVSILLPIMDIYVYCAELGDITRAYERSIIQ